AGSFEPLPEQVGSYGVRQEAELLVLPAQDLKDYPTVAQLRADLVQLVHAHGQSITGLARATQTTSPPCATTPVPSASPHTVTTSGTATSSRASPSKAPQASHSARTATAPSLTHGRPCRTALCCCARPA